MAIFDKFGEFGSADEINELAKNLLTEGDKASIKAVAKENGIPEDYAEMFISGEILALCDVQTAAVGKIEVEAADIKAEDIMADWAEYIKAICIEDEKIAASVRSKGKSLKGCIAELLKWSFGHQKSVDKALHAADPLIGIPGQAQCRKIIRTYYGEK